MLNIYIIYSYVLLFIDFIHKSEAFLHSFYPPPPYNWRQPLSSFMVVCVVLCVCA